MPQDHDTSPDAMRARRWRLILGGDDADGTHYELDEDDAHIDTHLDILYDYDFRPLPPLPERTVPENLWNKEEQFSPYSFREREEDRWNRRGNQFRTRRKTENNIIDYYERWGEDDDSPLGVWLDGIRRTFPEGAVRVMQRDAMERNGLLEALLTTDALDYMEPDIHLVSDILAMRDRIPKEYHGNAKRLIARLIDDLIARLRIPAQRSLHGSLSRAARKLRPRPYEIDWRRTIQANLKHYQPEYQTIIPDRLIGYGRQRRSLHEIFLVVDQSGSMVASTIYASIFSTVLASLPALKTYLFLFDEIIYDMSRALDNPMNLLFNMKVNLGRGTNISAVLAYTQQNITRPEDSICVLITDLYEGKKPDRMLNHIATMVNRGVQVIVLLALTNTGTPSYSHENAEAVAALGVPVFACTPDRFADMMGAAINGDDIHFWAGRAGFYTIRPEDTPPR
ncbi:MAG: VWA domain-containing protein [Anaerolineales bacterium]